MKDLAITLFLCAVVVLMFIAKLQSDDNDRLIGLTKKAQGNNALLLKEIERDDELLKLVFPEWSRRKPVMSTTVTVSCYTSRVRECDSTPHETADLSLTRRGVIAVSRDLMDELGLAFGDRVLLEGYGVLEVRDVMNKRWRRRVDIWSSDLKAAKLHGVVPGVTMTWLGG